MNMEYKNIVIQDKPAGAWVLNNGVYTDFSGYGNNAIGPLPVFVDGKNLLTNSSFALNVDASPSLADTWLSYITNTTGVTTFSVVTGVQRVQAAGLGTTELDRIGISKLNISMNPLTQHTLSVDATVTQAADKVFSIYVDQYNSASTFIGASQIILSNVSGKKSLTFTSLANAASCRIYFWMAGSGAGAVNPVDYTLSNAMMTEGTSTSYFDGFTTSANNGYRWTGVPNASMSEKYSTVKESIIANDKDGSLRVSNDAALRFLSDVLNPGKEKDPFSLECWFKPDYVSKENLVFGRTGVFDGITFDGDAICFTTKYQKTGESRVVFYPESESKVYYVVGIHELNRNILYVDGKFAGSTDITKEQMLDSYSFSSETSIICSGYSSKFNSGLSPSDILSPGELLAPAGSDAVFLGLIPSLFLIPSTSTIPSGPPGAGLIPSFGLYPGTSTIPAKASNSLAPASEPNNNSMIVDGFAIYKNSISSTIVQNHYLQGSQVLDPRFFTNAAGGAYFDLNDSASTVVSDNLFSSVGAWRSGVFSGAVNIGSYLYPSRDSLGLSVYSEWKYGSYMNYGIISGSKIEWQEDGQIVVQTSIDSEATWQNAINGAVIPGLINGYNSNNNSFSVKIIFAGGVSSVAVVKSLRLKIYTKSDVANSNGTQFFQPAVNTVLATGTYDEIKRDLRAGATINSGHGIITPYNVSETLAGMSTISMWVKINELTQTPFTVIDARSAGVAAQGFIRWSGNFWESSFGVVYVNGLPASIDMVPNRHYMLTFVLSSLTSNATTIGAKFDLTEKSKMQVQSLSTFQTSLTAVQISELYQSYIGVPAARVFDSSLINVVDSSTAPRIYAHNWSITSAG